MKNKIIIVIIFVIGFIAGAITINSMTIPARKAYRELLQQNYVQDQNTEIEKAIKTNNKLKAIVHLSNVLSVDPVDGKNLFDDSLDDSLDEDLFGFIFLPHIDKAIDELVHLKAGAENRIIGVTHGKLAALLDDLGYYEESKFHWIQASSLLEMQEDKAKETIHKLIDTNITKIE